ncbi:MAG: DinB family protein [Burkholderiales bacterium]|nr:DinB family protein [Burkholderiales bacterium]
MSDARQLCGTDLAAALRESRQRTLSLVEDLSTAQWSPPCQRGVNPVAWELAHIAWFAEFWILRGPHHRDAQGLRMRHSRRALPGPMRCWTPHGWRMPSAGQLPCPPALNWCPCWPISWRLALRLYPRKQHGLPMPHKTRCTSTAWPCSMKTCTPKPFAGCARRCNTPHLPGSACPACPLASRWR